MARIQIYHLGLLDLVGRSIIVEIQNDLFVTYDSERQFGCRSCDDRSATR